MVAFAGLALSVAAAAQQRQAAKDDATRRKNLATFNAQVQENEAKAKKQAAEFASKRLAKKSKRESDRLQTRLAKAGGLGSPVAEDLAVDLETEQDLLDLLIGFEGETAAKQARAQAAIDTAAGKRAVARGQAQATAATIGGGSALLSGFNTGGRRQEQHTTKTFRPTGGAS
jgi:hypothetical protein